MANKRILDPTAGTTEFVPKPTSALYPGPLETRRAFDHQEEQLNRASPFAKWQWLEVTFPDTANLDLVIRHALNPDDPESVMWSEWNHLQPSAPGAAPYVYRDSAANRRPWASDYIVLRCTQASAKMTLLLTLPRKVSNAAQSTL